jgi:ATP-dependent HslUV protease ATP-binding subunit HslU
MEKLLEEVSFTAGTANTGVTRAGGAAEVLRVDAAYVDDRLAELAKREDLSRYVL